MKDLRKLAMFAAIVAAPCARADGVVIDKIYHPYVDALESELEYRAIAQDERPGMATPAQVHQFSLGTALTSRLFTELYVIGEKPRTGGFDPVALEAELKWQLTEQGEYWADMGLLIEYENERGVDIEEFAVALLAEREWGNWSGTANFHLTNEWGDDIDPEVETMLALQTRYRYSRLFEPGVEFYAGQDTRGIGPVLQGSITTGVRKALHWEAGLIFGLDSDSADRTWRLLFEYEF